MGIGNNQTELFKHFFSNQKGHATTLPTSTNVFLSLKNFFSSQKGQAALSDSLYFLLIVSGLCAFLFFFSANYGITVEQQIVRQYRNDYATAALETILYSSTPRDPSKTLDSAAEVDYLLAVVKEDYADDHVLDNTNTVLADTIMTIMKPFSENSDYLFFIYMPEKKKFIYAFLFISEIGGSIQTPEAKAMQKKQYAKKAALLCNPPDLESVESIVESVGISSQNNSGMQMVEISEGGAEKYPPAQVNLTMWVPTAIDISNLQCQVYKKFQTKKAGS